MKVSIIITNFNYEDYLEDCIESCINQNYKDIEIILVDDGSTDKSKNIIEKYSNSIRKIYQKNQGMIGASNTGFRYAKGDIIMFLDADDYLYENAVSEICNKWEDGISKIHFRLQNIDENGNKGNCTPSKRIKLGHGKVWKEILVNGMYVTTPTTGNAYSRKVLDKIFPIEDAKINDEGNYYDFIPTDAYLKLRIPFYGNVISIENPLGVYRIHGKNNGVKKTPYTSKKKRQRSLKLSKLNSDFIRTFTSSNDLNWNEDILFRRNKMMVIRILSFRFDGSCHPWMKDTRFYLLLRSFNNLFNSSYDNFLRRVYNTIVNILLLIFPKRIAFNFLKMIHPKSFNRI